MSLTSTSCFEVVRDEKVALSYATTFTLQYAESLLLYPNNRHEAWTVPEQSTKGKAAPLQARCGQRVPGS